MLNIRCYRLFNKKMEMYSNTSQVFDIDMFMYSFQDIKFALSNYNLLYILIGKVLINESLILHHHKNKKKKVKRKKNYFNVVNKITFIMTK